MKPLMPWKTTVITLSIILAIVITISTVMVLLIIFSYLIEHMQHCYYVFFTLAPDKAKSTNLFQSFIYPHRETLNLSMTYGAMLITTPRNRHNKLINKEFYDVKFFQGKGRTSKSGCNACTAQPHPDDFQWKLPRPLISWWYASCFSAKLTY